MSGRDPTLVLLVLVRVFARSLPRKAQAQKRLTKSGCVYARNEQRKLPWICLKVVDRSIQTLDFSHTTGDGLLGVVRITSKHNRDGPIAAGDPVAPGQLESCGVRGTRLNCLPVNAALSLVMAASSRGRLASPRHAAQSSRENRLDQ